MFSAQFALQQMEFHPLWVRTVYVVAAFAIIIYTNMTAAVVPSFSVFTDLANNILKIGAPIQISRMRTISIYN